MKLRFSIRSILALTTLIAVAIAWYGANAHRRAQEVEAIRSLERVTSNRISFVDAGATPRPGPWSVVYTDDAGPQFLKWLRLDAFKRVVAIEFQGETHPELLAHVCAFHDLQTLSFDYKVRYMLTRPMMMQSTEVPKLIGAIRVYAALHPEVDIDYPDKPTPQDAETLEI